MKEIDEAAEAYAKGFDKRYVAMADFKAGIKWRDENPSEKVTGLVKALENAPCACNIQRNCQRCEALIVWGTK